jgi:hypothetical protein
LQSAHRHVDGFLQNAGFDEPCAHRHSAVLHKTPGLTNPVRTDMPKFSPKTCFCSFCANLLAADYGRPKGVWTIKAGRKVGRSEAIAVYKNEDEAGKEYKEQEQQECQEGVKRVVKRRVTKNHDSER